MQDIVGDAEGRRFWSRLGGAFRYWTPPIGRSGIRPFLWPRALVISRQRLDLDLGSYDFVQAEPVVGADIPLTSWLDMSLGMGLQYRRLLQTDEGPEAARLQRTDPVSDLRAALLAQFRLRAGGQLRVDRLNQINLEARIYTLFARQDLADLRGSYERTFSFGFDDLEIGVSGQALLGDVTFTDEVRVSDHLRGLYGDELFTDAIGSVRLEYRYSLIRELLKISAFHDAAGFRGIDRLSLTESFRIGNAFGVGLHSLAFDAFRLSIYGVLGFISDEGPDAGFAFSLRQLF
ncbi:MAG: hypothetical protein HC923_05470 [Myxococcales bacterium]|nr:hypothetical protein [Myxococcales bacterium]